VELKLPKVKVGLPRVLTPEEFEKLFVACETENPHRTRRNQLTLLFLFGLGCRVSELVGLDLNDFNATGRWVKVIGKGNRERLVPLSGRLTEELEVYLNESRGQLAAENENSILVNERGHRPSRIDIWRWMAAWSAKAGFDEPLNPHRFRHGFATALLENGADLRSIQMLLGHSCIQTTQIYTSVNAELLHKSIEAFHPLGKLEVE
jgi:integrase/recombinase XerD